MQAEYSTQGEVGEPEKGGFPFTCNID